MKPWQAYMLGAAISLGFVGVLTWLSSERPPCDTELGFWTGCAK